MHNVIEPPAVVRSVADLRHEWEAIVVDEAAAKHASETALCKLRDVGERLAKIKSRTPHGEWESSLKRYGFTPRSAQRRMQLADRWHDIIGHSDFDPTMGIAAALDLIAESPKASCVTLLDTPAGEVADPANESSLDAFEPEGADEQPEAPDPPNASSLDAFEPEGTQEQSAPAPITDAAGRPVPEHARAAFEAAERFREWGRKFDELIREMKELAKGPAGRLIQTEGAAIALKNAKATVVPHRPTHVCPYCSGGSDTSCRYCKGAGWAPEYSFTLWKSEQKAAKRGRDR
jgi:hypothetical protein